MKVFNFILLFFISITSIEAQTYFSFPMDSAIWSVEKYDYNMLPTPDACITRHYGYNGDTIINNFTYSKLYGNNLPNDYPYYDTTFNLSTATYVAAVREDSNKKVWVINPGDTTDILYYDFSLDSADIFCFDYFPSLGCHPVDRIDSILINGIYRKQIHFTPLNTETWIEGIGSTTGWFEYQQLSSWTFQLLCHKQNQNQLWGGNNCHCDTYTSVPEKHMSSLINIYPTPTFDYLNIILNINNDNINIIIRNNLGQVMLIIKNSSSKQIKTDVSTFPTGIYFLEINIDGKIFTKKIIKQ